jgi:hypothetical protein
MISTTSGGNAAFEKFFKARLRNVRFQGQLREQPAVPTLSETGWRGMDVSSRVSSGIAAQIVTMFVFAVGMYLFVERQFVVPSETVIFIGWNAEAWHEVP